MKFFFTIGNFLKVFLLVFVLLPIILTVSFLKSGEDIYKSFCVTCHSPQMAKLFQAPAAHSEDWGLRKDLHLKVLIESNNALLDASFDVKEMVIINSLAESAIKGTANGMPPKGTCTDCTKADLESAIIFMVSR